MLQSRMAVSSDELEELFETALASVKLEEVEVARRTIDTTRPQN